MRMMGKNTEKGGEGRGGGGVIKIDGQTERDIKRQ